MSSQDAWTPKQAGFFREMLLNWRGQGIQLDQMAASAGVSESRLTSFADGSLPSLTYAERDALSPVVEELIKGEDDDERDYRVHPQGKPPRTTRAIFREHTQR